MAKEKDKFIIKYGDRDFDLKAPNAENKKLWVKSLNLLKNYN